MIVTIIGKREICKEVKKQSDVVIHTTYSEEGVTGTAVKSFYVKSKVCNPNDIIIGKQYNIEEAYIRGGLYVVKCEKRGMQNEK